MEHCVNSRLEVGTYQIVCPHCGSIAKEGNGDFTVAARESLIYEQCMCSSCGKRYILETNPMPCMNRYDANNQYPDRNGH